MTRKTGVPPLPDQNTGWSALDLLTLLANRYKFILTFTFAIAVITAIVTLLLPPRYTAATTLLPPQQSSSAGSLLTQLSGNAGLAGLAGASLGIKNTIETYVTMFRSRTVEDAMIQRFNLQKAYHVKRVSDARKIFEKRSNVTAGLKDGVIDITVDASSPETAAQMANAYVEEFKRLASGVAVTEAAQRRVFFDRQLEESKDNLAAAEQDLKKTELTTGMVQPDSQSRAMIESAANLQGQIAAKEVQLQSLSTYATDNNPEVVVVKRQIAEMRAQLSRFTGNTDSVSDLFVPKGKVPEAALDYVRKLREVKYRETIFQAIASQFELAKLDEAKQGAIFQIIDPAVPPDKRSFPQRTIMVILSSMLAFLVACLWVWFRAAVRALRADPEDGPKLNALFSAFR